MNPYSRLISATLAFGALLFVLFQLHLPPSSTTASPGNRPDSASVDPARVAEYLEQAVMFERAGKWQKALPLILDLSRNSPESHIYYQHLGDIYSRLNQPREEAAAWELYWDHSPTPIEACPQIARAYEKQSLKERAVNAYERCFALNKSDLDNLYFLAHAYERTGALAKAEALYAHGVEINPKYTDLKVGLANVRLRLGRTASARDLAQQVLQQSPDNADALLVMGTVCERAGDDAGARRYFELGIQKHGGDSDFPMALAAMAEDQKDVKTAVAYYRRAADIDRNAEALTRLEALKRGHP